jgi:RNA polymerase sigma-70 factor (ECF subfamily)
MADEAMEVESLLTRLQAGDAAVLAVLFDHYRPRLRRLLRLRLGGRLAARLDESDVLQEAYLDAARQVEGYTRRPRVAFYVWLRGVVCQRLANLQRTHLGAACRAVHREQRLDLESSAQLAAKLLARGPSPSQALLKEERREYVQRALERLGPEDREVIVMRHFEGLSNAEVAEVLGLGASGATMRYGRALIRLKELLQAGLGPGESSS